MELLLQKLSELKVSLLLEAEFMHWEKIIQGGFWGSIKKTCILYLTESLLLFLFLADFFACHDCLRGEVQTIAHL
jgi:hypothetical protein